MLHFAIAGLVLVALVLAMLGLPFLQESVSTANTTIATYTANVSTWQGFPELVQVSPLLILILFLMGLPVLWWKATHRGR